MPHLSSHAILLSHFGFSHSILSGCSPSLCKLFLFVFLFLLYLLSFPPPLAADLESSRTAYFESLVSASDGLMDKAGETLACSSLSLPLATLVCPRSTQSESALLDCLSAPSKSRAPPTTTRFTSLLTDPAPSPHAPSQPAQEGRVMQLQRMFFICTLPHTSAPVEPFVFIFLQSQSPMLSCLTVT